ncbi:MAG TPA: phosphate ABC transporter substrate-binding protein [Phycisphaerae bacterium]|nr:phosphate ABC transporter substrate-binding protein [Phycisphaerae bacterium]
MMMRNMCSAMALVTVCGFCMAAPAPAQDSGGNKNELVVDGSTTVGPIAKALAEYYLAANKDVKISVSESGSGNGAKSLINSTCDAATMSRFMKDEEFKAAVDKRVLPIAHVIALDCIAVVVHPSNPVKNLTLDQVRDIYTGKITNWKQVGGPDLKIVKISRDTNSGTYESFDHFVMNQEKMAADVEYVGSNGAIRQRIQSTNAAIGYLGLGFVDRTVKELTIGNVVPTRETCLSGQYPISRPLYMFTNGYPKLGSHLHAYVTLYLTPKGQEIIEALGFVPLTSYPPAAGPAKE